RSGRVEPPPGSAASGAASPAPPPGRDWRPTIRTPESRRHDHRNHRNPGRGCRARPLPLRTQGHPRRRLARLTDHPRRPRRHHRRQAARHRVPRLRGRRPPRQIRPRRHHPPPEHRHRPEHHRPARLPPLRRHHRTPRPPYRPLRDLRRRRPAVTAAVEVDAPKVVDGLSAEAYHADKTSISSTGLRALLKPGCPAQFKYDRDNPQPPKRECDLGHAAHKLVLGEGEEIVVTEYDDWRTKAAREERDAIRARGAVPLLSHEGEQVTAMAEQIRRHRHAGPLFEPGNGIPERSIYWTDPATGVRCRVRPDWLIIKPGL